MADKFTEALAELKDALANGDAVEAAIESVAADHDVPAHALRNRATLAWGDLMSLGERVRQMQDISEKSKIEAEDLRRGQYIAEHLDEFRYRISEEDRALLGKWLRSRRGPRWWNN